MYQKIISLFVKLLLVFKGAKIGKNFVCKNFPKIELIETKKLNLLIGDNVKISGKIEIKQRDDSNIKFCSNCKIDQGVRIIVANNCTFELGENSKVMFYSHINCGEDIIIGKYTGISSNSFISSSLHKHEKGENYMTTAYDHRKILIGNNVQIGYSCFIAPGSIIGDNSVVGPLSYVTSKIESGYIYQGVPAKKISELYKN